MAYFEHYTDPVSGSNMNGGSDASATPTYSASNGGWNSGTGVFTPTSGDPSLVVAPGQTANIYTDGSTTPVFAARVTAVNSTTITTSTTAKIGTAPGTVASGITITVGGAWKGPNGAVGWPLNQWAAALTNAAGNQPRLNMWNNAVYNITAPIVGVSGSGNFLVQGYSSVVGDGGIAVIDGGVSGAAYILFAGQVNNRFSHVVFRNNGGTGEASLVTGSGIDYFRCGFYNSRGNGLANGSSHVTECAAYNNNLSNTAGRYGFDTFSGSPSSYVRCVAYHNLGSNTSGFNTAGTTSFDGCISWQNGQHGFRMAGSVHARMTRCIAYYNGGTGLLIPVNSAYVIVDSSVFARNSLWGVDFNVNGAGGLRLMNNVFSTNTSGNVVVHPSKVFDELNTTTLANSVYPWLDPDNGDFRNVLGSVLGAGRGSYLFTEGGFSGAANTVAYPDIGLQSLAAGGGGGGGGGGGLSGGLSSPL